MASFIHRLSLAIKLFFQTATDDKFAQQAQQFLVNPTLPTEPPLQSVTPTTILKESNPDAALQLLGLLQADARFIDFIEENIANYSDADIGAAARVIHEGSRKVLHKYFTIQAIRPENEESRITLQAGFDTRRMRLVGNVVGSPPFTGELIHRGWEVSAVNLPKVIEGHDLNIIVPAEVEL
ncbi:DUF2760 domain-containing protein [Beggiatoa leptomitoformis]|uniref:DUF2760 domain-containing protein n=1 Tax=Beggiatoa leptomitoformis TaxID=288004 RepID=A0A2N9YH47_9GAMM|nr:DUF2760 domain-containing protein [Beggiatoa leptomitoformis]ALG68001.1 DUF2760 domain-containing protein [Beggiatoa leptomitoformis]AUI69715.1 DUF2760 domain-containing protein [Beggiatoa leptomitoformis]